MIKAKHSILDSKFVNYTMGLLIVLNGILVVSFAKSRKDGINNFFRRSFTVTTPGYASAKSSNIIIDVQKYITERQKENTSTKIKSGVIPETIFKIAQTYQYKGDRTSNIQGKVRSYSLALLELEKLPHKSPLVVKQAKPIKKNLRASLQSISNIGVNLGDKRDKVELLYGVADKIELSSRYYPVGSVVYTTYDKIGLQFGIRGNRVFAINVRSNFKGISNGVQIGDDIAKIKALYKKGKISDYPGNNFSYKVNENEHRRTSFIFSDKDELVDGIKFFDEKVYGSWATAFK